MQVHEDLRGDRACQTQRHSWSCAVKERGAGASSVPPHGPCELHDGTVRGWVVKAFVSRSRGCWLEWGGGGGGGGGVWSVET